MHKVTNYDTAGFIPVLIIGMYTYYLAVPRLTWWTKLGSRTLLYFNFRLSIQTELNHSLKTFLILLNVHITLPNLIREEQICIAWIKMQSTSLIHFFTQFEILNKYYFQNDSNDFLLRKDLEYQKIAIPDSLGFQ